MRKILLFLLVVALAVNISNAQTKKRIFLKLNVSKQMERALAEQMPAYAQYISAGQSKYIAPPSSSNASPVFLQGVASNRVVFRTEIDQSDSAVTIKSKTNPDKDFAFTGLYDFPYRATIGNIGQIVGLAQFLPPMKGNFVVDTIVMFAFKPTNNGVVEKPVLNDVLLYPVTVDQTLDNFNTLVVRSFDQNLDNFIGNQPITIKGDSINVRVQNNSITPLVITPESFTIPAHTGSAFMLRPTSQKDTMRWLGTFEWGVKKDSRIYGAYITRPAGYSKDDRDSLLRALSIGFYNASPDFAAAFPSLANKGFRTNYSLVLGGMYEGDDDPNETYINASLEGSTSVEEIGGSQPMAIQSVAPNPITETGKMTFSIDRAAKVEISIVNSVGQTVAVIVNETMQSGTFTADIESVNLPSGIYNVVLNAGGVRSLAPFSVIH